MSAAVIPATIVPVVVPWIENGCGGIRNSKSHALPNGRGICISPGHIESGPVRTGTIARVVQRLLKRKNAVMQRLMAIEVFMAGFSIEVFPFFNDPVWSMLMLTV
jgi:hypothetical protein